MKNLALISSLLVAIPTTSLGGELQNLRNSNAEQKRQITQLEKQIDELYSLLNKANKGIPVATKSPAVYSTQKPISNNVYTVVAGDSLSKIANQHKISTSALMQQNKLSSSSVLQIGQKLTLPVSVKNQTTGIDEAKTLKKLPTLNNIESVAVNKNSVATGTYKVVSGDTMYSIAKKHGVPHTDITNINPNINPSRLQIGQTINVPKIPKAVAAVPETKTHCKTAKKHVNNSQKSTSHKVLSGDTMFGIARQYGMTFSVLSKANPQVNPTDLRIGQTLIIPGKNGLKPVAKKVVKTPTAVKAKVATNKVKKTPTPTPVAEPIQLKKEELASLPPSFSNVLAETQPVKPLIINKPMTMAEIASLNNTSVASINTLNNWNYRSNIKLAPGSEVYLPNK